MSSKKSVKNIVYFLDNKEEMGVPEINRRTEIETLVNEIILKNDIETPGFDLIKFLNQEGFQVVLQDMNDEDTTGLLFIDDINYIPNADTHKLIAINSKLQSQPDFFKRRRYIAAHEFAHSQLHKKDLTQYAHRDYSQKDALEEKEADFFARCLLMPKNLINQILELSFMKNLPLERKISVISKLFNVTEKKARIRLTEDLGYHG